MIRKATVRDVKAIQRLLKKYADRGELLPRSLSDLYDGLRDFIIYEEKIGGPIIGVCALHVCWEDLAEIRSLAVDEQHQGRGIGSELVAEAMAEIHKLGISRVFTLTYRPDFFARHGFHIVDKASLPHKIWAECVKCVKFPDCDEIAMLRLLDRNSGGKEDR
ncbi:MAG: N-acetyltransferase [Desulfobacterales bacterium]|nr:N-acetyltransferase [Desulfobacterales bacterium]